MWNNQGKGVKPKLLELKFGAFKKFSWKGIQIMKNNSKLPNFNSDDFGLTPFPYLFHIPKFTINK